MASHSLIIIILSVSVLASVGTTLAQASQFHEYYVSPDSGKCNDTSNCDTLINFAANVTAFFKSNTSFVFLPGTHHLDNNTPVSISNVESLSLVGCDCQINSTLCTDQEPPEILCTEEGGFELQNITNLTIKKLTITGCGWATRNSRNPKMVALFLYNTSDLILMQLTVQNTTGYGVLSYKPCGTSQIIDSLFQYNKGTQDHAGGNVNFVFSQCQAHCQNNNLIINSSRFLYGDHGQNNATNYASGLSILLECSNISINVDNVTMIGNSAVYDDSKSNLNILGGGGNMAIMYKSFSNNVMITNSYFEGGKGLVGGGLYVSFIIKSNVTEDDCESLLFINNTLFIENFAVRDGGGIYFHFSRGSNQNKCQQISFTVNNATFENNTVDLETKPQFNVGVAVSLANYYDWGLFNNLHTNVSTKIFNSTFKNNGKDPDNGTDLGYTFLSGNAVFYASQQLGKTVLQNCSFESNSVTAISAFRSYVTFQGEMNIVDNHGLDGGGLLLCESSYMILKPNTTVTIANNTAKSRGGGIFAERRCSQSQPLCFFQIDLEKESNNVYETINVKLINNTAQYAGNQIYGGTIDQCYLKYFPEVRGSDIFDKIFPDAPNNPSDITSDPQKVCFCDDGKPNCTLQELNITDPVSPGQTVNVSVALVGQMEGTVPGDVFTRYINRTSHDEVFGYRQVSQYVYRHCSTLKYTMFANPGNKTLSLSVVNPYYNNTVYFDSRQLHVTVKPCPLGFQLKKVKKLDCKCIDFPDIYGRGFRCDIHNKIIYRPAPAWIGYQFANKSSVKNTVDGVIYHSMCPFDFCLGYSVNISVNSTHFDQDAQCAYDRTGLLCGACRNGTSIAIGSVACLNCTGTKPIHIFGHIVLFLSGGILLVAILFICNITVTEGTITGLFFYLNIFEITHYTFLPTRDLPWYVKVFSVFVSVLNFNEGVESCFYDGLDMYVKVWIHFMFSVYIFIIAGMIVYLSKRYARIANFIGNNSIQVLATLFLLSYTKIILGSTVALSYATLRYPGHNGSIVEQKVWLYDGTVEYMHGKHIPLAITGVVFGLFALLYTFLLLFIQPLERFSHYKYFKWVARLKPLVDAYSSPHIIKEQYRFWNGLLLLFRFIFVGLAVSMINNPQLYLSTVTTTCVLLVSIAWSLGGIYKKWTLNLLTAWFFLNLAVLSISATYNIDTYNTGSHVHARLTNASLISLSIAALTFIGILIYHIYKQSKRWRCCSKVHARLEQISIFRPSIPQQPLLTVATIGYDALEESEPLIGRGTDRDNTSSTAINYTDSEEYRQVQLEDFEPDTY